MTIVYFRGLRMPQFIETPQFTVRFNDFVNIYIYIYIKQPDYLTIVYFCGLRMTQIIILRDPKIVFLSIDNLTIMYLI